VAILWSNTKPEGALQIKPHGHSCIMPFFAQVAMKRKTAAFDREKYGCPGARAWLAFATANTIHSAVQVSNSCLHFL
jgi:hypothetical protein